MLERLEKLAAVSVARGVEFAGLAIFCLMVGFAGHLPVFLKAGANRLILTTGVLPIVSRMFWKMRDMAPSARDVPRRAPQELFPDGSLLQRPGLTWRDAASNCSWSLSRTRLTA